MVCQGKLGKIKMVGEGINKTSISIFVIYTFKVAKIYPICSNQYGITLF